MERGELYDLRTGHIDGDLVALTRLTQSTNSLLEVGCGTGRVLAALDHVPRRVGVELRQDFADRAKGRLDDQDGVDIACVDFCQWRPAEAFDVVLFAFNVLAEFVDVDARLTALSRARAIVGPGGRVVLDNSLQDFASWAKEEVEYSFQLRGAPEWQCDIRCVRDPIAQISSCEVAYRRGDECVRDHYANALLTRNELLASYAAAGLKVAAEYGNYDLTDLTPDSELVLHVLTSGSKS